MNTNKKTFSLCGRVHYVHRDPLGDVIEERTFMNQIQDNMLTAAIAGIDTGTCSYVVNMAIGTQTGADQNANSLATDSAVSDITCAGTIAASTVSVQYTATFTARGTWAITEAGLFSAAGNTWMMAYNDGLTVNMTNDDTLQIDWDIIADQA